MKENCSEMTTITDEDLLAYADELLETELSAQVEGMLRSEQTMRQRLRKLLETRDQGNLGVGDIWRHERLSCPKRSELGLYWIGAMEEEYRDYIRFHLQKVGCTFCQAILDELQEASSAQHVNQDSEKRRKKLFTSSAGFLKKSE